METIHVHFERFKDTDLSQLIDDVQGLYVIWDARSKSRPTYIGRGNVLARLNEHRNRFSVPFDGYVAILGGSKASAKKNAEIIEALLLQVAVRTERWPTQNASEGNWQHLDRLFDDHGVVKVFVDGFDPFAHPKRARPIQAKKQIRVTLMESANGKESFDIVHDWRRSPR